jgi:hypothetical protein
MRLLGMLAIVLSLSGCAAVSKFKVDSDGMYRFKSQPFIVWAPKECLLDMAVRDTDQSVDFTTGAGYWNGDGNPLEIAGRPAYQATAVEEGGTGRPYT